ncbi:hypothetical protein F4779DRAFT_218729 [Xylariaceae sp. FL0662B]|nr:hypothetical protein F4779DRAFT_218729 [Xylariaceae sp. FL0662B]
MSFFPGTSKLVNTSPIPLPGKPTDIAAAVAVLHDHDFFLHCDPHYTSHKVLLDDGDGGDDGDKPPAHIAPLNGAVRVYEVVDHVPNPVWSSTVVSREAFADLADGLWVRIRSPLGIVMDTTWRIRQGEGEGEGEGGDGAPLELIEDVEIACSRLLLGIVRAQVEGNWVGIHRKLIDRILEDVRKAGEKAGESGA